MKKLEHVSYLWDDQKAEGLSALDRLVYRSNLLGADQRITNTGGGNTSSKTTETDPLTGEEVEVLWVKGSGGDLRTAGREHFASLYMDRVAALEEVYRSAAPSGPKTEAEDRMVAMYPHCTFNLNPRASSIDTPLHAFIPFPCVDHTHPNAVIAIAASKDQERLTREIYGDDVVWTPWQRPGFDLGLKLREVIEANPKARGIILGQHGLINWADDDKTCYELSLELIEKAARYLAERDPGKKAFGGVQVPALPTETRREVLTRILPGMRGLLSTQQRWIATWQDDEKVLEFVGSKDALRLADLGTSCPDHFLRTKIKPLYLEPDAAALESGDAVQVAESLESKLPGALTQYQEDYRGYYEACRHGDSPPIRDAAPTVILIPGVGMVAWGKSKSESRVTAEFYNCAIEVMRGAESVSEYIALPQQEAFDIEYWWLEENKLRRMPPEQEMSRKIAVVVGAGSGIGRELCYRLAGEGAHLVAVDLDDAGCRETVDQLTARHGLGIGVAGSGVSNCGPGTLHTANITKREEVKKALDHAVLAYGGMDYVAVTAGVFAGPGPDGKMPDDKWALSYGVNVFGHYLCAIEAGEIFQRQNLSAAVVLTTSANGVVAKKGSLAYDTSKAAANHLVRELAMELSPLVRVNAVAPATVVKGSAMFPRDRVMASLSKYDIPYEESASTEELRDQLAQFYAERTLTKQPITPEDQAEAIFLLLSERLAKTTGQIIPVDGGLQEAFLR